MKSLLIFPFRDNQGMHNLECIAYMSNTYSKKSLENNGSKFKTFPCYSLEILNSNC